MKKIILLICICFIGIIAVSAQQKVFKGKWVYTQGNVKANINLNLYSPDIPNEMDMDGAMCYGVIVLNDGSSYYSVEEVTIKGNTATLNVFNGETDYFKVKLTYNPQTQNIEWISDGKKNKLPVKILLKKKSGTVAKKSKV